MQEIGDRNDEDEILKGIRFSKQPPFVGSIKDWQEFIDIADHCIQQVSSSNSLRDIVIETWLLIDFCVRDLLLAAFDLKRFNHDEFDLRYELLPKSFHDLLLLMKKSYKAHQSFSEKNIPSDSEISPISITVPFMMYCYRHDNELMVRLEKARQAYISNYYPHFSGVSLSEGSFSQHNYINKEWLMLVQQLPDSWYEQAEKLNAARNLAAHTHNQDKIALKFGVSGPQVLNLAKAECIKIINELLGIIPKPDVDIN